VATSYRKGVRDMDASEVLQAISAGAVDDHFDAVYDAIKARRKVLTTINTLSFKPGLVVRTTNLRPNYLNDKEVEIVRKADRGTRWLVRLNETDRIVASRYLRPDGETISVLPQCLEPIGS